MFSSFTLLCHPSTIQHPVANAQEAKGSCCSWWKMVALLTWEGELHAKDKTRIE